MPKKLSVLPILVILFFTLVFVSVARSAGAESGPNFQNAKIQTRDISENLREQRQDVKDRNATRQAEAKQKVIERIKKVFEKILNRFQAALNRLNKISDKIQSRIDKLEERGVDVANAQSMLDSCASKRDLAEAAIADSKSKVNSIDPNSSGVKQAIQTAVSAIHSAKKAVRDYHKCLVDVTRTLRASSKEASSEAN